MIHEQYHIKFCPICRVKQGNISFKLQQNVLEITYKFFLMKDSISALSADPSNTTEDGSNLFSRCFGRKSTTTSLNPYFSLTVASSECAKRMDSLSLSAAFRKASEIKKVVVSKLYRINWSLFKFVIK